MTKESLANLLDGREYRKEIELVEVKQAKEAGLIVLYGASDDLLEAEGALNDEYSALNGVDLLLFTNPKTSELDGIETDLVREMDDPYEQVAALESQKRGNVVSALWDPKGMDLSWFITTDLPHATFNIFEDGELCCRGIVLDVKDLR
jgi:hypothetical protein